LLILIESIWQLNVTYADDRTTYQLARDIARRFLSAKTGEDEHLISAVGTQRTSCFFLCFCL
jgi:hypothetical protein